MSIRDDLEKLDNLRRAGALSDSEAAACRGYLLSSSEEGTGELSPLPPRRLAFAVIATLIGCTPFGIIAIIRAGQVVVSYQAGDYAMATKQSRAARWWAVAAIACAVVGWIATYIISTSAIGSHSR